MIWPGVPGELAVGLTGTFKFTAVTRMVTVTATVTA
jgi:hypothetical protein